MDVSKAIQAKSDQLNADDLIGGPRTIRVRDVKVVGGEQPVSIFFDGDDGKPWKPCKTAMRCVAAVWGVDAATWVGKHLTIYNDPEVTWAGMAVGGIRVSHMEGLTKEVKLMLAKTRGKKGATVIKPLVVESRKTEPKQEEPLTEVQEEAASAARKGKEAFAEWWKSNPDKRAEANAVMDKLKKMCEEAA